MNKPRVTLRQRVLHLRAIIACRLLGLGKLRYWVRSKEGIYTYLKGERGEMVWLSTDYPVGNFLDRQTGNYLVQCNGVNKGERHRGDPVNEELASKGWEL